MIAQRYMPVPTSNEHLLNLEEASEETIQAAADFITGFQQFLRKSIAIELAIGLMLGQIFTDIVQSLLQDILTPPIELLLPSKLHNIFWVLKQGKTNKNYDSPEEASNDSAITLNFGIFIEKSVQFLAICFIVYLLIRVFTWLIRLIDTKEQSVSKKKCSACLQDIPVQAQRCSYCTSWINERASLE